MLNMDCMVAPLPVPKPGQQVIVATDPPYSDVTHNGRRTGSSDGGYRKRAKGNSHPGGGKRSEIRYAPLTRKLARAFVERFVELRPEWWIFFGDHITCTWWYEELKKAGQYAFAPVPWVKPDAAPRKSGEGPDPDAEWVVECDGLGELTPAMLRQVADEMESGEWFKNHDRLQIARAMKRIRRYCNRDGWYCYPTASTRGTKGPSETAGRKPLPLCRRILTDYAEHGALVIDPFSGEMPMVIAAVERGLDVWACEIDERTFVRGKALVDVVAAQQTLLPLSAPPKMKQSTLDLGDA